MKKILSRISIFVVVITVIYFIYQANCTHNVYEISFKETLISNDSVGNDWNIGYSCNGKKITDKERWYVPIGNIESLNIKATATERDKWSDVGVCSLIVVLKDDFETSTVLKVTENKGRYKGNQAQWNISCKVKLVKRVIKK